MLSGVGRGRGRGKLLENGPPAPLRRPRERTSVPAAAVGPAGEPQPQPQQPQQPQVPRVPSAGQVTAPAAAAGAAYGRGSSDVAAWPAGLNPLSAPFVPQAPAYPVTDSLSAAGDSSELSSLGDSEPEPVNTALITEIPAPEDSYQAMIYNNIAETLLNMSCTPASFDRQGAVFVDNLNGWLPSSGIQLTVVLDWMLNQVACVPTFRYVCAKLCHLMCSRCRVTEAGKTFRDILLSRCQALYRAAGSLLAENVTFFGELTMLFCELYLHVRLAGGEEPIAVLGGAVLGLCGQLIEDPTPERVTALCQALKLTGAALERQSPAALDAFMERVRAAAFDSRLPRDGRHALLELQSLRVAQWGGQAGPPPPLPSPPILHRQHSGYGTDDAALGLSLEESSFFEQQLAAAEDELEDEVDEAYEMFLDELERRRFN